LIFTANPDYNRIRLQWKNRKGLTVNEHDLVISPLSQEFEKDGHTVKVDIYSSGKSGWVLDVEDANKTSTVWDGTFESDELALAGFYRTVEEEGIASVIGPPD
jgi:hypothetical protein